MRLEMVTMGGKVEKPEKGPRDQGVVRRWEKEENRNVCGGNRDRGKRHF